MSRSLNIRRKNNFNVIRDAKKLGSFDDFPMLRPEIDPQYHASVNSVDQPFHLSGQKDMVLAQLTGKSRVLFRDGPARYFDLGPGDFVYVPANAEHRILTKETGILIRYKARKPGTENVVWTCAGCGSELYRHSFDASSGPAQREYHAASETFNADADLRTCKSCNTTAPKVDLDAFQWQRVAEAILLSEEDDVEEVDVAAH